MIFQVVKLQYLLGYYITFAIVPKTQLPLRRKRCCHFVENRLANYAENRLAIMPKTHLPLCLRHTCHCALCKHTCHCA